MFNRAISLLLVAVLLVVIAGIVPGCAFPQESGNSVPFHRVEEPSSAIEIILSISEAPALNVPARLTCTLSSVIDAPNTTAQVKLPDSAIVNGGHLTWQGDLKVGEPVSFSAEITFKETGKWVIEGVVRCVINQKYAWGDLDRIYLNIGTDHSELGWPSKGQAEVEQIEKGDAKTVKPSSKEEPDMEDLPDPPAVTVEGIVEVTASFTKIGLVQVVVTITKIAALADIPGVRFVRLPWFAVPEGEE